MLTSSLDVYLLSYRSSAAKPYSSAVDIWSLGTVIFHLLASKPPFKGSGEDQGYKMLRAVIHDDIDYGPLTARGVEAAGIEFLSSMIDIDGESRPSAKDLLRHPWIQPVDDIVSIPNLEESQIFHNPNNDVLETLDEEEEWDGLQTESFLKAARALIKTPTPDAPSLTNGETSAEDKVPVTENDCSDGSSQVDIESVAASQIPAELANQQDHDWDGGPPIGSAPANQSWFKKPWPSHYGQGDQIEGSISGSEDDTPQQGSRPGKLFGEVSQDPNEESGIFGGESQPTIRPLEGSPQSPPRNSPSLFGTESRMNNLNMQVSRPNKISVLRSAVTNSMIHGKRYRSTATSGSDESNTSSIEEPVAKRSMVKLGESININGNTRLESESPNLDVTRSLSQKVDDLQISSSLATLIPIPGCLSTKELSITTRLSNFGRADKNTNIYEDLTDSRIPRRAFDIYFFSAGFAHRDKEWYKYPDVNAVIMTRCSTGIKVNGCHVPTSDPGTVFKVAKLRTGDLIEVYNSGRKKLVYRCAFHVGESKFPRGADEDVVVEDNAELYEAASASGGSLTNAGGNVVALA